MRTCPQPFDKNYVNLLQSVLKPLRKKNISKMVSKEEAKKIALVYINKGVNPKFPIVIIEDEIVEYPEGYVFPVNTKQYVEDGNCDYRIAGASPVFVDKIKGDIFDPYKNEYLEPETLIRMFRKKMKLLFYFEFLEHSDFNNP